METRPPGLGVNNPIRAGENDVNDPNSEGDHGDKN
jgi:hypothetical protein